MQDTPLGGTGFGIGTSSGSDFGASPSSAPPSQEHICPTCGAKHGGHLNAGLEQFLGRLGISEEMDDFVVHRLVILFEREHIVRVFRNDRRGNRRLAAHRIQCHHAAVQRQQSEQGGSNEVAERRLGPASILLSFRQRVKRRSIQARTPSRSRTPPRCA